MSWLDPDRLAALYGKKPLKKAEAAALEPTALKEKDKKKAKKKEKKALKKAEKAAKKARKELQKQLQPDAAVKVRKKKPECCEKYKKGKRCKDCPLV